MESLQPISASQISELLQIAPTPVDFSTNLASYSQVPFSQVPSLGLALKPAIEQSLSAQQGKSGLYWAKVAPGTHMVKVKGTKEFITSSFTDKSNELYGQARLKPVPIDPTTLLIAAAIASINAKLDSIQQLGQNIYDYVTQKDKAAIKSDLVFLNDTLSDFKYNWNNSSYKIGIYSRITAIRKSADENIIFHSARINAIMDKKSFMHLDRDVEQQLSALTSDFSDYRLAVYLYAFASFLESILADNFSAEYIATIKDRISARSIAYLELYTQCYNYFESFAKNSVETVLKTGIASASAAASKLPLVGQKLSLPSQVLSSFSSKQFEEYKTLFIQNKSCPAYLFTDNIEKIQNFYSQPRTILFDAENVYLEAM